MEDQKKHTKRETLAAWRNMQPGQRILPHFTPVPYKATGSRYGACGIRIDGNPQFIDAVLSNLKDVIDGENHVTRLELARHVVDGSGIGKQLQNADRQAEVVYIRLHVRGEQGAIASGFFDKHLDAPTERFAHAIGETY